MKLRLMFLSYTIGMSIFGTILPGISLQAPCAIAAERVILKYSILQESVSVAELSDLANKGAVSPALASYLNLANKKPDDLRRVLDSKIEVNPLLLSKVLNSFVGNFLLDQVAEVIHTPSTRSSRESLRGALVTSALADGNISLIEVLENYPTEEIYVEGDRLAQVYQEIKGVIGQIPRLPF